MTIKDLTDQEIIDRMDQIFNTTPVNEMHKDELELEWNMLNQEMYARHTPEYDPREDWPEPYQY